MRKKLTPGQGRALTVLLGLLTLILVPLGASLRSGAVLYVGLICYIAAVWAWFCLNRCPHCRKHLGTNTSLYCPNCGEKL